MSDRDTLMWSAVYGAAIARQVFDHMDEGRGPPEDDDMDRFHEEAETIAYMAGSARERRMGLRREAT